MKNRKVKTVLFVCVENACRSQLAEAISNHYFSKQLKAFSAGSNPAKEVNPKATSSLENIGIIHRGKTKSIDDVGGIQYDYVVKMGCGDECPVIPGARRLEWNIPDPKTFQEQVHAISTLWNDSENRVFASLRSETEPSQTFFKKSLFFFNLAI